MQHIQTLPEMTDAEIHEFFYKAYNRHLAFDTEWEMEIARGVYTSGFRHAIDEMKRIASCWDLQDAHPDLRSFTLENGRTISWMFLRDLSQLSKEYALVKNDLKVLVELFDKVIQQRSNSSYNDSFLNNPWAMDLLKGLKNYMYSNAKEILGKFTEEDISNSEILSKMKANL